MNPLWALLAEVWWVAPTAAGAGALGWFGVRRQRTSSARRLELDAAKHDVQSARDAVTRGRVDLALADAELVRAQADRAMYRASERDVSAARRGLQNARQAARTASINLRARRVGLRAARSTVPRVGADPAGFPLARLVRAHNVVLARWMQYETDAAKLIAYPSMSDGRSPMMAAFLQAQSQAALLRPASPDKRMTPADFSAYRDAVRKVEQAFDAAEHEVLREAHGPTQMPLGSGSGNWADTAYDVFSGAQRAVVWAAEAVARASDGANRASKPTWPTPSRRTKPPASS